MIIIVYKSQIKHYGLKIRLQSSASKGNARYKNALVKFFNTAIEKLQRKAENLTTENAVLKKEMVDLKSSRQFDSDAVNEKFLKVDTKVYEIYIFIDKNIQTLIDDHKNLHVKVRDLEDSSRRIDIWCDALLQAQGED